MAAKKISGGKDRQAANALLPPFGSRQPVDAAAPVHFVQVTDIHLSTHRRCLPEDLRQDLERIVEEARPDFIIASGDLSAGGKPEEFAAFRQIADGLPVPLYPAAGNHDDDSGVAADAYRRFLGPLHYSFDWGPLHFAVYDGEAWQREGKEAAPNDEAFPWIRSAVDDWLEADIAAQPPGRPSVIVNHYPWGERFYRRFYGSGVIAALAGHWHSSRRVVDSGGIAHYATPSLCFGGIDQSERGYRHFTFSDGELRVQSRPLGPRAARASSAMPALETRPDMRGEWPQFHGGPGHTGYSPSDAVPPLARAWRAEAGGAIHSAGCVLHRGRVVQTTWDDDCGAGCGAVALDAASGRRLWRYSTRTSVRHAAACAEGRVYLLTVSGDLSCLDLDSGRRIWSYALPAPSERWVYSAPTVHEGRVFFGVSSHLVALDAADGSRLWLRGDLGREDWISSFPSPAACRGFVAVAFYAQPASLAVLDASNGETVWRRGGEKSDYTYSTPLSDGTRLYAVSGSAVRAFEMGSGQIVWECPISLQRIQATPAFDGERLYVATGQGQVHAISAQHGTIEWTWQLGTEMPLFTPYLRQGATTPTSPVVGGGTVWVAAADGFLYALEAASGRQIWRGDLGAPLAAPPALGQDGMWIGATDGTLHALSAER